MAQKMKNYFEKKQKLQKCSTACLENAYFSAGFEDNRNYINYLLNKSMFHFKYFQRVPTWSQDFKEYKLTLSCLSILRKKFVHFLDDLTLKILVSCTLFQTSKTRNKCTSLNTFMLLRAPRAIATQRMVCLKWPSCWAAIIYYRETSHLMFHTFLPYFTCNFTAKVHMLWQSTRDFASQRHVSAFALQPMFPNH